MEFAARNMISCLTICPYEINLYALACCIDNNDNHMTSFCRACSLYFCPSNIICTLAPQIIYMPSKSHVIVPPWIVQYSTLLAFNSHEEEEREPFLLPPSRAFNVLKFPPSRTFRRSNEHLLLDCEQILQISSIYS